MAELSLSECQRYRRHMPLPEVGPLGQAKLKKSSVLIVGLGGLGAPVALYLAAAGVGRLGLVDFDSVDESNLQRQILYRTEDVGHSKVDVAAKRIRELNPFTQLECHQMRFAGSFDLLKNYDCVVDATDNFKARYAINAACVVQKIPNVHASVYRFEGHLTVFAPHVQGPCYRCLFPHPPPKVYNCVEGGVMGAICGVIGSLQATEVLKVLLGVGDPLIARWLWMDGLSMATNTYSTSFLQCGCDFSEVENGREFRDDSGAGSGDAATGSGLCSS